jgi:hypothetical protein
LRSCRRSFAATNLAEALVVARGDEAHPQQRGHEGHHTPRAIHQLTSVPPHMQQHAVPNSSTSGTSGMPSFMAGRVAPL